MRRSLSAVDTTDAPPRDTADTSLVKQDAALGRFARHLAHDVNNYLAAMLSRAELIGLDLPEESPVQADIEELIASAEELRGYLRRVVSIAATTSPSRERGSLDGRVGEVLTALIAARPGLSLETDFGCDTAITLIAESRWRELLLPLLDNAREAYARMGVASGVIRVATRHQARDAQPDGPMGVSVTLTDAALGISPDIAPVIFEPLASTKRVRGAGLSLSLLRRLVHAEGGTVQLGPAPHQGTVARLWFPDAD
jgi:signal transduction histidine kinase